MALEKIERVPKLLTDRLDALNGTKYELSGELRARALADQPVYDRVFLWQWPEAWYDSDKADGTSLYVTDVRRDRNAQNTPRGIVIGIGLGAMDALRSHGIWLGHIVHFGAHSPYRRPLDNTDKKYLVMLHAGDLTGSEDLARLMDEGKVSVSWDADAKQHVLVDAAGVAWDPRRVWMEV